MRCVSVLIMSALIVFLVSCRSKRPTAGPDFGKDPSRFARIECPAGPAIAQPSRMELGFAETGRGLPVAAPARPRGARAPAADLAAGSAGDAAAQVGVLHHGVAAGRLGPAR